MHFLGSKPSSRDIEHLKMGCLNVKIRTDRGQSFVFQNEEWQISDENINTNINHYSALSD